MNYEDLLKNKPVNDNKLPTKIIIKRFLLIGILISSIALCLG